MCFIIPQTELALMGFSRLIKVAGALCARARRLRPRIWKTPDSYLKLVGSIWHFLESFALRAVPHFVFRAVGGFAMWTHTTVNIFPQTVLALKGFRV